MKYLCNHCQESFEVVEPRFPVNIKCPRCVSNNVGEFNACSREVGPPPWEYVCPKCRSKFRVRSPSGPDEAKAIRCPICQSDQVKWLALVSETCPSGG